jgi:hypothetical protein
VLAFVITNPCPEAEFVAIVILPVVVSIVTSGLSKRAVPVVPFHVAIALLVELPGPVTLPVACQVGRAPEPVLVKTNPDVPNPLTLCKLLVEEVPPHTTAYAV